MRLYRLPWEPERGRVGAAMQTVWAALAIFTFLSLFPLSAWAGETGGDRIKGANKMTLLILGVVAALVFMGFCVAAAPRAVEPF